MTRPGTLPGSAPDFSQASAMRHSQLISLGKLKDVSFGILSVAHQLGEAIVAFQVAHLNTRTQ